MKLQVLYFSPKGAAQTLAENVGKVLKSKCDKIPPAYPCDNEKLVFIGIEPGTAKKRQFVDFMKSMSSDRAKNIAFFSCGASSADIAAAKALVNNPGVAVVDSTYECAGKGLFTKKPTFEEIQACNKWAEGIVAQLFDVQ